VLAVHWAVARHIKGGVARGVFTEFVAPKSGVVLLESDPIRIHVREEVVSAEGLEEGTDVGAVVWRDESAVRQPSGSVGRGNGVVLAGEVAVLGVGAVAEVGPAGTGT
jgi:hypothetical protein